MKYHRLVKFDIDWHTKRLASAKVVNTLLWRIDDILKGGGCSPSADEDTIYLRDSAKEVYHAIVRALDLGVGDKDASSTGISAKFSVDGVGVNFSWSLPETCEVIYNEEPIPEDQIVRVRKTVKEVICEKPLMQSVFPDWVEEENGNSGE